MIKVVGAKIVSENRHSDKDKKLMVCVSKCYFNGKGENNIIGADLILFQYEKSESFKKMF